MAAAQEKSIVLKYAKLVTQAKKISGEHLLTADLFATDSTHVEQQELEKQIEIEKARRIVILSKAELRTYYKEALLLEGKMLINYMVKEITLYNDRVVITFNSPLRTSPDDSQDFSFYEEEAYMDVVMRNRGTVERHNQLLSLTV